MDGTSITISVAYLKMACARKRSAFYRNVWLWVLLCYLVHVDAWSPHHQPVRTFFFYTAEVKSVYMMEQILKLCIGFDLLSCWRVQDLVLSSAFEVINELLIQMKNRMLDMNSFKNTGWSSSLMQCEKPRTHCAISVKRRDLSKNLSFYEQLPDSCVSILKLSIVYFFLTWHLLLGLTAP